MQKRGLRASKGRKLSTPFPLMTTISPGSISRMNSAPTMSSAQVSALGACALSAETCAIDIVGAEFIREIEPGEMVVINGNGVESFRPFEARKPRFCIFEHVYFSRPDSIIGGESVYETRRRIGVDLAREAPVDADLVCPVPDSGPRRPSATARKAAFPTR